MAEIQQNRVQESRPIQSGVKYSSPARKEYDTPNQMVGSQYKQEAEAWNKTADAIGSVGFIFAKMNESRERLIADDIKDEMDENHQMDMEKLISQTQNTSIENLDFKDMLYGWEDRNTNDFKIGPNGADGKPSILIKSKALEDYDLPGTQKRELEKHYKTLEKKGTEWIYKNVPEIQQKKDLFYLTRIGAKAQEDIEAIFRDTSRYEGGIDSIFLEGEEIIDRATGEPIIFNKTPYTNELGILAQQEVNEILTNYDIEIAKRMDAGTLPLEVAIDLQKKFSQDILYRQFQNDKVRNPAETYLKVTKHGYAIERDLRIGRSGSQKAIMYEVRLPSDKTDAFVNTWSSRLQREGRADIKKADADALLVKGMEIEAYTTTKDFLENPANEMKDVVRLHLAAGRSLKDATASGLTWLNNNRTHDEGISKRLANNMRSAIEQQLTINPEGIMDLLTFDQGEDKIAIPKKKLDKVLLEKFAGKFVRPDGSKYTRKEEIAAIETITHGEIQTIANNKVAHDVSSALEVVTRQWEGMLITDGGRGHLAREFFDFNKDNQTWVLNREKMQTHRYRKRFGGDANMSKVLMKIQNALNAELHKQGKVGKTHTDLDIEQKNRFNSALSALGSQQSKHFYDGTRNTAPNEKEREETLMRQDTTDIISQMLWKTAKALGHSEEKFNAMGKEKQLLTYLDRDQLWQLNTLERDLESIQMFMVNAYPDSGSSLAELKWSFKEMTTTNINNRHTSNAVNLVAKYIGNRIDALSNSKIWSTSFDECKKDMVCAIQKLNMHNVNARDAYLVTPENHGTLSGILKLK